MTSIYIFMLEHPVIYTILITVFSGFAWLLIFALCASASDADARMEKHIMDLDEFERDL